MNIIHGVDEHCRTLEVGADPEVAITRACEMHLKRVYVYAWVSAVIASQGIPAEHRPWAWLAISGADDRRHKRMAGYFDAMVHKGEVDSEVAHQIELVSVLWGSLLVHAPPHALRESKCGAACCSGGVMLQPSAPFPSMLG